MPTSVLWNLIGGLLSPLSRRAWRGRISQLSPKPSPSCDQVAGPTPLSGGVTALWGQPGPENQRPMGTPGCDMGGSFRGNTRGWGTNGVTLPLSSPETPGLAQGTWPRAEGRGQPAARGPHSPLAPLPPSAPPVLLPVGDWECLAEETPEMSGGCGFPQGQAWLPTAPSSASLLTSARAPGLLR